MKSYIKIGIFILLAVGIFLILKYTAVGSYLTWDKLQANKMGLQAYVAAHYISAVFIFIGIYIAATALSVPGAFIITLAGGFLFTSLPATVYVNVGATCGAIIIFLISRYLLGETLQEKYGEKLNTFNKELDENGKSYLLMMRLIPVFPFWMINIFGGLTKIPLKTFAWTTALGIIPGSFVYAFAGSQLGTINSPKDILSGQILAALIFLGLLSVIPIVIKKIKGRNKSEG